MLATLLELSSVAAKSITFGEAQASQAPAATELTGVEVGRNADGVTVTLKGNGKLAYGTLQEADRPPLRLVVDFPGVRPNVPPATPGQGALRRVRVALNNPNPLVTRVVLDLDVKVTYSVKASPDGREVTVVLAGPAGEQTAAEPARSTPAPVEAPASSTPAAATRLTGLTVGSAPEGVTLTLKGNGHLPVGEIEEAKDAPPRLVLSFPGVRPGVTALTSVKKGIVDRVRVAAAAGSPGTTRVVVEMAKQYAYRVSPDATGRNVVVTVGDPSALGSTPADFTLAKSLTGTAAPAGASARVTTPSAAPAPAAPLRTPRVEQQVQERKAGDMGPRRFTGHPISLDFQGVDLRAVLRTFAEITGLNLVIDPEVKGIVDVSLHEVPWDHALDIILRANQLDYTVEGTIVRIAPIETLQKEGESRRRLADEQALSGELVTVTKTLSYAKAADVAPLLLRTALTKRASIQVDPRTNNLIITDLQAGIDRSVALLVDLDAPQPQVEIEARIVRTTKDFAKELGIQWGFNGKAAPELSNTTPLAFPNSIRSNGSAGAIDTAKDFAKLSLGALNGAFGIDAALSALETDGKVQVLLKPRVVTQNNIKATITRGEEIPYTTLTAAPSGGDGVQIIQQVPQVSFKTAALTLAVLPRISATGTVILEIDVDNGSRGTVQANGNISVNTQRVQTTVLVKDQGTTVIGGIYETLETRQQDRTPGLARVPFIGNLFKRSNSTSNEGELLVFITPRILKNAEAVTAQTNMINGAGK